MIPGEFIDEVLARTDIVEIVDGRVALKKNGQNYSGLCPFHNEKTPSFTVSQDKQFYYCFGCQASGSALKFVMEFDRVDFVAAVEILAGRLGMEVPRSGPTESKEKKQRKESIYSVLENAADFFKQELKSGEGRQVAVEYLKSRGLTGQIARDFGIGFAPSGWDHLYKHIAKTNELRDLLVESGMVVEKDEGKKIYDRFRERIMFPIRDARGRVIAFGGRAIGDAMPKYLNSPETPVFHKSRELYGLYEARKSNRRLQQLLVVEGYMDVVALAQNDISYAVATLGTATTAEHLDRLFRVVPKVVFSFDGDNAGRNAAWKALVTSLPAMKDGRSARFLFLPDGEDPDSLVRQEGKLLFEERLETAQHLPDFFFEKLLAEVDVDSLDGRAHLAKLAMPLIHSIPFGVFRELMLGRLAELTHLAEEKLVALVPEPTPRSAPVSGAYKPDGARGYSQQASPQKSSAESPFSQTGASPYPGGEEPPLPMDDYPMEMDYPDDFDGYLDLDVGVEPPSTIAGQALSLLLGRPDLVSEMDEKQYQALESVPGCRLLVDVIHAIVAEDIESGVLLLARYQDRVEYSHLSQYAEQEQLLGVSEWPELYRGIITKLLSNKEKHESDRRRRELLGKPFAELSGEEREELKALTVRRNIR